MDRQPELRAYRPNWNDQVANFFLGGDERPSPTYERFVRGLTGSIGLGQQQPSPIDPLTMVGEGVAAGVKSASDLLRTGRDRADAGDYGSVAADGLNAAGLASTGALATRAVSGPVNNALGSGPIVGLPKAAADGGVSTPIRAYHWSQAAGEISPANKFRPFSHFGEPDAARDRLAHRNNQPAFDDTVLRWLQRNVGDLGGTIPVDLHMRNPLRMIDSGSHIPPVVAYDMADGLKRAGHEVPAGFAEDLAWGAHRRYIDGLPDNDIKMLARRNDVSYLWDEFDVKPEDRIDWMRKYLVDQYGVNYQNAIADGESGRHAANQAAQSFYDNMQIPDQVWEHLGGRLDKFGHDGIVYKNLVEGDFGDSYIATRPGTVKSATTGETLYSNPDRAGVPGIAITSASGDKPARLHHNGPVGLPNDRPSDPLNYFGTKSFSDMEGMNFGEHRYVYDMPPEIRSATDLMTDSPEARRIIDDLAEGVWGERPLEAGQSFDDVIADFYDVWADRNNWEPYIKHRGLSGLRYGDEFLLPKSTIDRLKLVAQLPDEEAKRLLYSMGAPVLPEDHENAFFAP